MKKLSKLYFLLAGCVVIGTVAMLKWKASAREKDAKAERKIACYQDSMHPWVKSDKPGKCTICSMDLTPIYEGEKGFGVGNELIVLNSNSINVLHVQSEAIQRQPLLRTAHVAGTLEASESRKVVLSAPSPGRIHQLSVDYAGMEVQEGQHLFTFFSPELVQKRRTLQVATGNLRSVSNELSQVSTRSDPFATDFLAPQAGTVVERPIANWQYVSEGEKLLTIVDMSVVWFRFDIYQQQLPWFQPGQTIDVTVDGLPGKVFPAVISFIEPVLNDATRTLKVRAEIKNPLVTVNGHAQRHLRLGMYAEGRVHTELAPVLTIPRSAILFPGRSAYAYVEKGDGAYERRRLKLGRQGDKYWEVLQGVEEGEMAVTSGNVLLDAQAQFTGNSVSEEMMTDEVVSGNPDAPLASGNESHRPSEMLRPAAEIRAAAKTPQAAPEKSATTVEHPPAPEMDHSTNSPHFKPQTPVRREAYYTRMAQKEEMRARRWAAIAEAQGMAPAATAVALETNASNRDPAASTPNRQAPSSSTTAIHAYRSADTARRALSENARIVRAAAIAEGQDTLAASAMTNTASEAEMAVQDVGIHSIPSPAGSVANYRATDSSRMAFSREAQKMRAETIAEARAAEATATNSLTQEQRIALKTFLLQAGTISRALASDNLDDFKTNVASLPDSLAGLGKNFGAGHPWQKWIQQIGQITKSPTAKSLEEARKQFLPFSTAVVELAQQFKKQDASPGIIKIYHCPMAPKPGLWIQNGGSLANPFYGSEMLRCGQEVKST